MPVKPQLWGQTERLLRLSGFQPSPENQIKSKQSNQELQVLRKTLPQRNRQRLVENTEPFSGLCACAQMHLHVWAHIHWEVPKTWNFQFPRKNGRLPRRSHWQWTFNQWRPWLRISLERSQLRDTWLEELSRPELSWFLKSFKTHRILQDSPITAKLT